MNRKPLTAVLLLILALSVIEITPDGIHVVRGAGDFGITATLTTIGPISSQGQGSTLLNIFSVRGSGFNSAVNLTTLVSPSAGLSASVVPSKVTVTPTSNGTATLTVNATTTGSYQVVVTGSSGSLSHSVTVTVNVISGGIICVGDPATTNPSNPCPPPPPVLRDLPPTTPPRQLSVGVYINGSVNYNTFDITLLADHKILKPIDVSLAGSTLGNGAQTLIKCIGGVPVSGQCKSTDTADTIHFAATGLLVSTTGLLFTAIYNVTGSTGSGGTPIGFQVGCTGTSVRGICVNIGQGSTVPAPERAQGGFFDNVPDFGITIPGSVTFTARTNGGSALLRATSFSGFSGTVTLSTAPNSTALTASFTPPSVTLTSGGRGSSTLNLQSSSAANYTVLVTATSGSLSHSVNVTVIVLPRFDFSLTATPSIVTFDNSTSGTSIIKLTSTTGYTGLVNITTIISPITGLGFSYNNGTSLTLRSLGSTNSSAIAFTSSKPGDYLVTIYARNGTSLAAIPVHRTFITVHVADFNITANPPTLTVYQGGPFNSTLSLFSRFNFAGTVSLTANVNASGLTAIVGNSTVTLSAGGSNRTLLTLRGTILGNYLITITAARGAITHKTSVNATVKPPDFALTASLTTLIAKVASTNSSAFTLTRLGGFNGTIVLTALPQPPGVAFSLAPGSIKLNATLHRGTSILGITVAGTAVPGTYPFTVTGANNTGTLSHQIQVSLIIPQPDFVAQWTLKSNGASAANNFYEVNVGLNFLTQIQLFGVNNFAGSISLTATFQPSGLTYAFDQSNFNMVINGPSPISNLTITPSPGTAPGNYTVTLTTNGTITSSGVTISHVQRLFLIVGDFQISAATPTIGGSVGFNSTAIVTISTLNHFNGNVTLTSSSSTPNIGSLLNATFITLRGKDPQSAQLLVMVANNTAAVGTYTVTVTGGSGLSIHPVTITITVVLHDVAIASVSFVASSSMVGATVTFTINVKNQGTVPENVTVDALAEGFTVGEMKLTGLQPGETRTVTITWSTNNYAAGNYPVGAKVLAVPNEATTANNVLYSSQSFVLNAPPPPLISQSLITEIAAIGGAIAVIAIGVTLVLRRRKPMQTA